MGGGEGGTGYSKGIHRRLDAGARKGWGLYLKMNDLSLDAWSALPVGHVASTGTVAGRTGLAGQRQLPIHCAKNAKWMGQGAASGVEC